MVKCPKCNEDIDSLIEEVTRTTDATVELSGDETRLEWDGERITSTELEYSCPECREILAIGGHTRAIQFLKGELELVA